MAEKYDIDKIPIYTKFWFILLMAVAFTGLIMAFYVIFWCAKEGEIVSNPYRCCTGTTFIPDKGSSYRCVPDTFMSGN